MPMELAFISFRSISVSIRVSAEKYFNKIRGCRDVGEDFTSEVLTSVL